MDNVRSFLDLMNVEYIDFFHVWCLRKMEHFEMAMQPELFMTACCAVKRKDSSNI